MAIPNVPTFGPSNGYSPTTGGVFGSSDAAAGGTLLNSTNYYYQISATNADGESALSTERFASTDGLVVATHLRVGIIWFHDPTGGVATGYKVYGRVTGGGKVLIATIVRGPGAFVYIRDDGVLLPFADEQCEDIAASADDAARRFQIQTYDLITGQAPAQIGVPPVLSGQSPSPGSNITPEATVSFDATADGGLFQELIAYVVYADILVNGKPRREIIYMDGTFSAEYVVDSTCDAITDGFHFSVKRVGGWPDAPTFYGKLISPLGAENV